MTAEATKSMQASPDPCKPGHPSPALPGLRRPADVSGCLVGSPNPSMAAHNVLNVLNYLVLHLEVMLCTQLMLTGRKRPLAPWKKLVIRLVDLSRALMTLWWRAKMAVLSVHTMCAKVLGAA